MVKNTSTSFRNCMVLIRIMLLKCLKENVLLSAEYVKSCNNELVDLLSRDKLKKFMRQAQK